MPIINSSNNRVLPNNARAVDVARESVKRIAPVQARRYDAAFRVQGYHGILYTRLTTGTPCSCCDRATSAYNQQARLDENGHADAGTINALLTSREFGTSPLGVLPATTQAAKHKVLEIAPIGYRNAGIPVPDRTKEKLRPYDTDNEARGYIPSTFSDHWSQSETNPTARTVVPDGHGPNGPTTDTEEVEEFTVSTTTYGATDSSCPICFGSGFVGGYSVLRGWRKVLVPTGEADNVKLLPGATIDFLENPPRVDYGLSWQIPFPLGAVAVDSVRVFRDDRLVTRCTLAIDGITLRSERDILQFCDGRVHTVSVQLQDGETLSHVEIQVNQSTETANFEFPRKTKSADMNLLERTTPFQLVFSPLIPLLKTQDIVVESVTGMTFQIKECTDWHDNKANVLGWEATVRPTQPFETYSLLPKRAPLLSPKVVAHVIDNSRGHRRT